MPPSYRQTRSRPESPDREQGGRGEPAWYSLQVHSLQKGEVVAQRFRVLEVLGRGAMSAVYLAEDLRLPGARWAVKELVEASLPDAEREMARVLFQREGEILASLNHPGLPRILDAFSEPGGRHYLVMERIPGVPLDELLEGRTRPLLPQEALPIALQAVQVLEYLHGQAPPVVFRDLKPSNLMISPLGRVRFIDFGIARLQRSPSVKDTQELGTPGFCAPEQYHGQSTPRSDLYSLGVTLFYLLTLADPQSFQFQFPPLSGYQPVPPQLEETLARSLALNPQDRQASAAALRVELEEALRAVPLRREGATQALTGPLVELGQHACRVPGAPGPALWRFWREWFLRTFHLDAGISPRRHP